MKSEKIISVAMAVYQGEQYIREQIESILSQLDRNDELVISYDKSSDKTLDIINKYAERDARVRVINNLMRPGITGNFNNAIEHCSGDYIYISDQDDVWVCDKIARIKRCFEETGADMVMHNGIDTDKNMKPISGTFFDIYRIGNGKLKNIVKFRGSGCCIAFTAEMKDKILPLPEINGYDQWIALVCEYFGTVVYLEDVLIYHRLHDSNVTTGKRRAMSLIIRMRFRLIVNLVRRWIREKRKGIARK